MRREQGPSASQDPVLYPMSIPAGDAQLAEARASRPPLIRPGERWRWAEPETWRGMLDEVMGSAPYPGGGRTAAARRRRAHTPSSAGPAAGAHTPSSASCEVNKFLLVQGAAYQLGV